MAQRPPTFENGLSQLRRLGQANAVEDADSLVVQLDAGPVRVAQIEAVLDAAVRPEIFDARLVQLSPGRLEMFAIDGNRNVLDAADRLVEVRMIVAREVEEAQEIAVPDVEEEVG